MYLKTTDLIYPDKRDSLAFVIGSDPFPTIGIDLSRRALFFIMLNTNMRVLVVHIMGTTFHL